MSSLFEKTLMGRCPHHQLPIFPPNTSRVTQTPLILGLGSLPVLPQYFHRSSTHHTHHPNVHSLSDTGEVSVSRPPNTQSCINLGPVAKKLTSIFTAMLSKYQIYDMWKATAKFLICISCSTGDRLKALAAKQVKPRGWKELKSI